MNLIPTRRLARRAAVASMLGLLLLTAVPQSWFQAVSQRFVSQATGSQIAAEWRDMTRVLVPTGKKGRAAAASIKSVSVAVLTDGGVIGWGGNSSDELNIPTEAISGVMALAVGDRHNLALKSGAVLAWGTNSFGQLTIPTAAQSGVTALAAGTNHSVALKNGGVIVWGYNGESQLTVPVAAQSGVTAIAAGGYHTLALKNGGVIGWGRNDDGEVTIPTAAQSGVIAIEAGFNFSLALKSTGQVLAWGNNDFSQLSIPVAAQSGVTAIAGGRRHVLALKNGGVIGWGSNSQGQRTIPIEAQSGVTAIAAGSLHSLALKSNGQVLGWGTGSSGESTIPLIAQSGVLAIAGGELHSLAIKPLSPPDITVLATPTRQQATAGSNAVIAVVNDAETAVGDLVVTATSLPSGITVTSINNTDGAITAAIAAGCTAAIGSNTVVLTVTDGDGESNTANLTVNVTANPAPTLSYGNVSLTAGTATTNSPTTATDNGSISSYLVQSPGTYTGTLSVNAAGAVSLGNAAPLGTHTITIRATDNCGATKDASFMANISAPAVPNMIVKGNNTTIANGDSTPGTTDGTDFGSAAVNTNAVANYFTIENSGTGALSLTGTPKVSLSGAQASDFSIALQPVSPVAATNGTTTFLVNFAPTATGTRTATVSIANNDPGHNPYTFTVRGTGTAAPANGPACGSYTNRTPASGLGSSLVHDVFAVGSTIYAATSNGLSISTDGGVSFVNRTTANGLGDNRVLSVYAIGGKIYAGTGDSGSNGGLSISTDGGATFTNRTTADGLPTNLVHDIQTAGNTVYVASNLGLAISTNGGTSFATVAALGTSLVWGVYVSGSTVYAATGSGLAISTDGGSTFTTRTTANGLGANYLWSVYAAGSMVYAATNGAGLSISTDGGASFTTRTTSNGLGSNDVRKVFAQGGTVYAATASGLSISTDGGANFSNYTTANGLGNVFVNSVFATSTAAYAATPGGLAVCPPINFPIITPVVGLTRQQGSPAGAAVSIATVSDVETPAGNVTVTATTVPAGITVTGITNTNGTISASLAAACNAALGNNTVVLTATDGNGLTSTADLIVNVTANSVPTLIYNNVSISVGFATTNSPATASDNGSITGYSVQSQGTYTGTVSVNASVMVSVSNAAPLGNHTISIRATDTCGAIQDTDFTLSVISPNMNVKGNNTTIASGDNTPSATDGTDFGSAAANTNAVANYFTIENTGISALYLTGTPKVALSGANAADFSIALQPVSPVAATNGMTTFLVNFAPSGTGSRTATVSIANDDSSNNPYIFTIRGTGTTAPVNGPACGSYTNRTPANGLGSQEVNEVFAVGNTIYAATNNGFSISTDGGLSFVNRTTANGLGSNVTRDVQVIGSTVYVATNGGGVAISTDGGASFTTRTTENGLANNNVLGLYVAGNRIYAATFSGLSLSTDGGTTFTIVGTAQLTNDVYVVGSVVYAATINGLSISTDGGATFTRRTTAHGLGNNFVNGVFAAGNKVYATTSSGLSISTDGGATFTNRTTAHGLGNNFVFRVYALGSTVYAATGNGAVGGISISTDDGASFINYTDTSGTGPGKVLAVYATSTSVYAGTVGGLSLCPPLNSNPIFMPAANISVSKGLVAGVLVTVGTVSDAQTAAGSLTVTSIGGGTATGVAISGITNTNGTITAVVTASCLATSGTVWLQVSDGALTGTGDVTINVMANTPPTLTYANASVSGGAAATLNPATGPTNNGSGLFIGLQSRGTYTGLISVDSATGVVILSNAAPSGTHTIIVRAADSCGTFTDASFTLTVNNTAPTFTPAVAITLQQGTGAGAAGFIGTVSDPNSPFAGSLLVAQIAGGTATGITVSGITNTNGTITAVVTASCSATAGTLRFQVSNGSLTGAGNLQVNVVANTAPTLVYPGVTEITGGSSTTINPVSGPSDNGSITDIAIESQGPFTGLVSVNSNGVVSIANAAPIGTYGIIIRVTDNCGLVVQTGLSLRVVNTAPTFLPAATVTRQQGSLVDYVVTVGTVNDEQTATGSLTVTQIEGGTATGINVNGIVNVNGTINAVVSAACTATSGTVRFRVYDGILGSTGDVTVNVIPDGLPILSYNNAAGNSGTAMTVSPATGPSDNGSVASLVVQNVTPALTPGTLTINNSTGVVTIPNNVPVGNYTVTIRATDNCGLARDVNFSLLITDNIPRFVPAAALTLQQSSLAGAAVTIGTVSAGQTAAGSLIVTPSTGGTATGITVSGVTNNAGVITAVVSATCTATSGTVRFQVSDGISTSAGDLTVNVTGNTAPTLSYSATPVSAGMTTLIAPVNGPSDNGTIASLTLQSVAPNNGGVNVSLNGTTGVVTVTNATLSGTYTVIARAVDNCGLLTDASFTLNVTCPTISMTPTGLPNGVQGTAYHQVLTAAPSGISYSFAVTTGSLPAGLTLASDGTLSGTPTAAGSYSFGITARGFGGCSGTQSYSVLISGTCPVLTLTPASLPGGTMNTAYERPLSATGGTAPYSFAVTQGALPMGLSLDASTGVITGTPTQGGTFSFRVTATSQGGCTGARQYVLTITCATLSFTPAALPNALLNSNYSQTLTVSSTGTYTFSMLLGSLPPGFMLSSAGVLSGRTSQAGTYNFTVRAVGACQGLKAYTLVVGSSTAALALLADYDGDGQHDPALWSNNGIWRLLLSSDGANRQAQTQSWGAAGDLTLLGDYDGDGHTDLAVFRPGNGTWYVKQSSDGVALVKAWGVATDVPIPGDYDGDGKTDIAVFRPSEGNWYVLRSSDQQAQVTAWGAGYAPYYDLAVPGDYDGDGQTDLAVFRRASGTWLVKRSRAGQMFAKQWGLGTDIPVAGDYDADGRTDIAVWRGSTGDWYIWQSTTDSYRVEAWGTSLAPYFDQAVPGDYDGDGSTDLAVWRANEGRWYVRSSQLGAQPWSSIGQPGAQPVAAR